MPPILRTVAGQGNQGLVNLGRDGVAILLVSSDPEELMYISHRIKVMRGGAIVGEFVASQSGLGYVIITTQSSMNTPVAFAALVWTSILGLVLFGVVAALSRLLVPWAEDV